MSASTPKISFRVPTAEPEASGDVTTHDISTAPGKEREREPLYGGELANMGSGDGGESLISCVTGSTSGKEEAFWVS